MRRSTPAPLPGAIAQIGDAKGRYAWVQVLKRQRAGNGREMKAGDGASLSDEAARARRRDRRGEAVGLRPGLSYGGKNRPLIISSDSTVHDSL